MEGEGQQPERARARATERVRVRERERHKGGGEREERERLLKRSAGVAEDEEGIGSGRSVLEAKGTGAGRDERLNVCYREAITTLA